MRPEEFNRRDFHKLSAAALCGLISGTTLGCNEQAAKPPANKPPRAAAKKPASGGKGKRQKTARVGKKSKPPSVARPSGRKTAKTVKRMGATRKAGKGSRR